MKKRVAVAVTGAALALAAMMPAGAAAVEVGNDCVAGNAASGVTILTVTKGTDDGLPLTTPISGVVTKWTVKAIPLPDPGFIPHKLKVFRGTPNPQVFQVVAESATGNVRTGTNVFPTRIPVAAGDRFGSYGITPPYGTLFCESMNPADTVGGIAGDAPVGATSSALVDIQLLSGVSATVEPDVDGDGFGDETQDACPASAKLVTACPVPVLTAYGVAKPGTAVIIVASTVATKVTATGSVKVPGAGAGKGKGRSQTVKLSGSKNAVAGKLQRLSLRLPQKLKKALAALPTNRSLTLGVSVTAPNPIGGKVVKKLTLKLKGQKPKL